MHLKRILVSLHALRPLAALALAGLLAGCFGDGKQSTIISDTDSARVILDIYALVTWITLGIFVVVAVLLAYALIRYRAREGQEGQLPRQVHGNTALELIWTIIPALILIFIAVPTWSGIFRASQPPEAETMTVRAVGHQWWWEFEYPEQGITSGNEMFLPVDRPVVVETTSDDVIHSFWVPRLAGKIDSVPGKDNLLWFTPEKTGLYYGQCAEFCGTSHANMRFRVHVVTQERFDEWVANQQRPPAVESAQAQAGEQLFVTKSCISCHQMAGQPLATGVLGPDLSNLPSRTSLAGGMLELSRDNLVEWILRPQEIKPGNFMNVPVPAGEAQAVSQEEAELLAAYLLSEPAEPGAQAEQPAGAAESAGAADGDGELIAEQIITQNGCGACHVIPGVEGTAGTIGPSLEGLSERETIAEGALENTPENMRTWLSNPQAVKPDSVMPNLNLSESQIDTLVEFLSEL